MQLIHLASASGLAHKQRPSGEGGGAVGDSLRFDSGSAWSVEEGDQVLPP